MTIDDLVQRLQQIVEAYDDDPISKQSRVDSFTKYVCPMLTKQLLYRTRFSFVVYKGAVHLNQMGVHERSKSDVAAVISSAKGYDKKEPEYFVVEHLYYGPVIRKVTETQLRAAASWLEFEISGDKVLRNGTPCADINVDRFMKQGDGNNYTKVHLKSSEVLDPYLKNVFLSLAVQESIKKAQSFWVRVTEVRFNETDLLAA